ncbi:hypothetical protein AVEN_131408-1 [Araneus ventricosus]|uniref:Uncharacterized protein n=1 Tax=Araneus ventricosus TaxID=182803 RepID=A0A4Y2QCT1_ARAVE|nr:hypothetical protein AVEN_131408-1 [Araneus ventricosus]
MSTITPLNLSVEFVNTLYTVIFSGLVKFSYINVRNEGYFGTDRIILNIGRLMCTTPELAPPLQASAPHQWEYVWSPTYDLTCSRPNTRRIFSRIWFRTWSPPASQSRPYH